MFYSTLERKAALEMEYGKIFGGSYFKRGIQSRKGGYNVGMSDEK